MTAKHAAPTIRPRWLLAVSQRCGCGAAALGVLFGMLVTAPLATAQPPGSPDQGPTEAQRRALDQQQQQLAERYRKVEELLLRLADVEAAENPERAALLRRAARQSREKFILERLETAADSLSSKQFQQAIDNQTTAREELQSLLKLLTSEDRPQRIRAERERLGNLIKGLKRIERTERATRARTEKGADLKEVESEQRSITERTAEMERQLADENAQNAPAAEADDPPPGDAGEGQESSQPRADSAEADEASGEGKSESDRDDAGEDPSPQPGDEASSDEQGAQSEDQPAGETRPEEGEGEAEDGPTGDSAQPAESSEGPSSQSDSSEGQPSQGSQSQGQQSQGQQSQRQQSPRPQSSGQQSAPQTPEEAAQRAVQQARKRMEAAQRQLEEANREQAVEQQRKAEEELRAAIDQLERILRQLREEEMLRELARLESRLRQMAQMQTEVLDKTRRLAETPAEQRDRQVDIRAGNLAFEERKIVLEADRAILLLREEGSSVAFPEVVGQMRSDMVRVAERLTETKIDGITQGIQEDILAALEEMIAALQQAQRDLEEQQRQQQMGQQQQSGQPGEQPLVQPLAELKLLRTMQTRIKSRTENYAEMIPGQGDRQTLDPDLLGLLQNLSDRQQKLYRITRDLLLRRNR